MRLILAFAFLLSPLAIDSSLAAKAQDSRLVRGPYFAKGRADAAGVRVQYTLSKVVVTKRGRIFGGIQKYVTVEPGTVFGPRNLGLRGNVGRVRLRGRTFVASATILISDGVVVRGKFRGLVDKNRRLARYFRGHFSGDPDSRFVLLPR